jgi:AGCS family alanine or glycine:cation symporter
LGSVLISLRVGCSRGVFTNEAGMGTASMAHGAADVSHPVEQGLMGIVEVFLDTIILCTMTALVILVSGIRIPYGSDAGGTLTISAFSKVCGSWSSAALAGAMCCFAFATILGWGLYGSRCVRFLFGQKAVGAFAAAQTMTVVLGAVLKTETIWLLAELFNGFMSIPNLIALAALTPELCRLTNEYKNKTGGISAEGGYHADFHQCQPLRALSHEKVPSLRGGGGSAGKKDLSSEYWSA